MPDTPHELLKAAVPRAHAEGALDGVQITQRKIAKLAYDAGWKNEDYLDLHVACMVCGAESWRFSRARNDNYNDAGVLTSRDCGLWQINIPASQIGTSAEENLYVVEANAKAAYTLFKSRGWQPWVAYNTKVYLHDTYLQWALLGVANYADEILLGRAKTAGQTPKTRLPWISVKDLKKLYPDVVLG